jgi:hypothetical protein
VEHTFEKQTLPWSMYLFGACSCGWRQIDAGPPTESQMIADWEHHLSVAAHQAVASLPAFLCEIAERLGDIEVLLHGAGEGRAEDALRLGVVDDPGEQ